MPQAARTFRIFVSSTFNDLKAERNALQEHVYPMLKELCERHGARFQAIDLRWGVSEEAALDQQAINICLTEVDRCRETSPKPNFIVLLGDRYGWRPPPPQVPASEFEAILTHVSDEERERLVGDGEDEGWYLKDENAEPPEYVLKEREGEYREFEKWDPVERDLASALRSGVGKASLQEIPEEARTKYFASATEQEIERGALRVQDAPEHVFCFFREITNRDELFDAILPVRPEWDPDHPERALAEDFIDLVDPESRREPDPDAADRLEQLKGGTGTKEGLRDRLPDNVEDYEARWTGDGITTDHIGTEENLPGENLDDWLKLNGAENPGKNLCVDVWLRLSRVILAELEERAQEGALDKEIDAHETFGNERARNFVPRLLTTGEDAIERIASYVDAADPHPLGVAGVSGSGKSALVAKAAIEAQETHPGAAVVRRFIGATPESSDGRALLASLCQEISRHYGEAEAAPADYRELVEELPKRLALAAEKGRLLVIFLDALDQLSDAEGARSLIWLPAELPHNVRIVVSALRADRDSADRAPKGSECYSTLEAKLPADSLVELRPMSRDEGEELLDLWLKDAGRALRDADGRQRDEVLSKFAAGETASEDAEDQGLPLYLKLAFEEARRWRSFTRAEKTELAPGIQGIIRKNLFARLSGDENHGRVMVAYSLGYLGAAKNGLSEDELLDVLSEQKDRVLKNFQDRSPRSPKVERLPVVVWSRLYFDLEPYLGERSADGTSLMSFYHRQLREVVERDYLIEDGERLAALDDDPDEDRELHDGRHRHRELADYFADDDSQPLERPSNGEVKANLRRLSELPYQQTAAAMWDEVYETLTDFHFLEVKAANSGVVEAEDAKGNVTKTFTGPYLLQDDFALALERMPGGDGARSGRRRVIVTATDFGDGLVVRCPHCNVSHTFEGECEPCQTSHHLSAKLGDEIDCPNQSCNGPLKLNQFVVERSR